jgi:hypothetical protein
VWSFLDLYYNDLNPEEWFFRKFNFDEEKNFPSIFSGLLHFIASILLFTIWKSKLTFKHPRGFWLSLCLLFLYTGLDEILRIHEKVDTIVANNLELPSFLVYAWVVPYIALLFVLSLFYIKPLFKLPKKTLVNFIISAIIFLTGAVGVEILTGWYISHNNLSWEHLYKMFDIFVLYTIEELLEMTGISFFIYELARFIKKHTIKTELN